MNPIDTSTYTDSNPITFPNRSARTITVTTETSEGRVVTEQVTVPSSIDVTTEVVTITEPNGSVVSTVVDVPTQTHKTVTITHVTENGSVTTRSEGRERGLWQSVPRGSISDLLEIQKGTGEGKSRCPESTRWRGTKQRTQA